MMQEQLNSDEKKPLSELGINSISNYQERKVVPISETGPYSLIGKVLQQVGHIRGPPLKGQAEMKAGHLK